MRSAILALVATLTVGGALEVRPPKSPPPDVGPGRIQASCRRAKELGGTVAPGFPFNLPDGRGAIALVLDPAGHPVGMYSRTPLASGVSP